MDYTGANSVVLVNQALNADQANTPPNNSPHLVAWNLERNSLQYVNTLTGQVEKELLVGNSVPQTLVFANPNTTWNYANGSTAYLTLTGDTTLAITNALAGTYGTLRVTQDGVGNHALSLPANSEVANDGQGAIEITQAAGSVDFISYYYDGTTFWWQQAPNFTGA